MKVKHVKVCTGKAARTGNDERWDILEDTGKYVGSLYKPIYLEEYAGGCTTYYPYCCGSMHIEATMYDAVKGIMENIDMCTTDYRIVDLVCNLFFEEGYTLA